MVYQVWSLSLGYVQPITVGFGHSAQSMSLSMERHILGVLLQVLVELTAAVLADQPSVGIFLGSGVQLVLASLCLSVWVLRLPRRIHGGNLGRFC